MGKKIQNPQGDFTFNPIIRWQSAYYILSLTAMVRLGHPGGQVNHNN